MRGLRAIPVFQSLSFWKTFMEINSHLGENFFFGKSGVLAFKSRSLVCLGSSHQHTAVLCVCVCVRVYERKLRHGASF